MRVSELRIGNYIADYECEPYFFEVEQICKVGDELCVLYRNGSIKTSEPEPILLTEEWLIKFGFEKIYKSKIHSAYYIDNLTYYFWYEEVKQYAECKGLEVNCEYVHELQNLYFALTKEELIITK